MAKYSIDTFHPKTAALLFNDNAAGQAGAAVIMGPLFQKVLLGQMPAKEFADTFADRMTEAQAKYSKRVGG